MTRTNANATFWSEDLDLIPLDEMRKVWNVEISYIKERKIVVAAIALVECSPREWNGTRYVSMTRMLFGDTSKCIKICNMKRLNQKKLDSIQQKLNENLGAKLETILNHTQEPRTICDLLANVVWQLTEEFVK